MCIDDTGIETGKIIRVVHDGYAMMYYVVGETKCFWQCRALSQIRVSEYVTRVSKSRGLRPKVQQFDYTLDDVNELYQKVKATATVKSDGRQTTIKAVDFSHYPVRFLDRTYNTHEEKDLTFRKDLLDLI